MRHGKKFNHLGRTSSHRKAMLSNMAASLIKHKRIKTTLAKAKALRIYVEPLITKSKEDTTHSRRTVFSYLQDKDAVNELFREVAVKVSDRPGGYTRILKLGPRLGDSAEMCLVELVDFNENMLATKESKARKTRRSRRGTGTSQKEEAPAAPKAEKPAVVQTEVEKPAPEAKEEQVETPDAEAKEETPEAQIKDEAQEKPKDDESKDDEKKG